MLKRLIAYRGFGAAGEGVHNRMEWRDVLKRFWESTLERSRSRTTDCTMKKRWTSALTFG